MKEATALTYRAICVGLDVLLSLTESAFVVILATSIFNLRLDGA